jgi:O-acetyl-ADP-ribose deacetylase (regulator of RNase III)
VITVVKGDLFASSAQTLVNTVNCVGVMGKGIALGFRKRFPAMFEDYVKRCEAGEVTLGRPYLYTPLVPPWILNFPTKDHWRSVARLDDIIAGLDFLEAHYKEWGIESLAVPPLGCGEGQLDWNVVGRTLFRRLRDFDVDVELYAPFDAPEAELDPDFLGADSPSSAKQVGSGPVRVPPSAVALAVVLRMIERERFRWPIGRIVFQKLAYFATQAGIPTGLDYRRGSYGPFAEDLKRLQTRLANNGLVVEERRGNMFELRTGSTYPDAVERYREDLEPWREAMVRVADLLMRVNGTKEAEVLASAHFVAAELTARSSATRTDLPNEQDVVRGVLEWKLRRRPPLQEAEVAAAVRKLNVLGWVALRASDDLQHRDEFAERVG